MHSEPEFSRQFNNLPMVKNRRLLFWFQALIAAVITIGVFFRCVNLDKKVYWNDEIYTAFRISGYTETEISQQIFNEQIIDIVDVQKYFKPNSEKSSLDTIKSLASEDSQHPPLYYLMERFWVQCFGNSVLAIRSLPVLISLLVFPAIFWLCQELFQSSVIGWVAVALIAVSPFHVLYAQEARQYSLWTVLILLSSASLLRAMRLKTFTSWLTYTLTLTAGLYTFPFSLFVAVGHGIYIAVTEKFKLNKTVFSYLFASLVGFLFFLPWLWVMLNNASKIQDTTSWSKGIFTLSMIVKHWLVSASVIFLDFNTFAVLDVDAKQGVEKYLVYPLIGLTLILVVYSIYFVCRHTPQRIWLFILTLTGTTALALIIPDLILGERRSTVPRYVIPCYLGIQLTVAYLLTVKISSFSAKLRTQKFWQLITIGLVSIGILSCAVISPKRDWWNKANRQDYTFEAAQIVNAAAQPLVISDDDLGDVLSFSYLLDPKVKLQLRTEPNISNIPDSFSDVFLFKPSKTLLQEIEKEKNFKVKPLQKTSRFWRGIWRLEKL